ncbi:MAG: Trp operon repressor [Chlamydiae bacterium]|nr:Trp operon repressor [Chlamydiota bacterium]
MKTKSDLEEGWWHFIERLAHLKKSDEVNDYLDLFLTHSERRYLGLRFLIIQELVNGEKTQREMAESLGVSIAKITRGSNALKDISSKLRRFLE